MKSSMYRDYIEEQSDNRFVQEFPEGFITYNVSGNICQLEEIYIVKEHRRKGLASQVYTAMEAVAKEYDCEYLKGSIVIGTNNAEGSLQCLLKNGFKLSHTEGIIIYFMKQLGG